MTMMDIRFVRAEIGIDGGKAPERILLYREGWNQVAGEEPFLVDEKAFNAVSAYLKRRGNDLVCDYEHQTLKDMQAPAAGWIRVDGISWEPGAGIMATVSWTDRAAGYIAKREYRYFSPVSAIRKTDQRLIAIHSVALTNTPRTDHLSPLLAAKLGADIIIAKEDDMDFFEKLFNLLGLKSGSTEEEVYTAVAKLKDKPPETREVIAKDVLAALDLADGDVSTVVASIHALKQGHQGMVPRAEFDALKADLAKRDAVAIVAKATAAGKITPDQKAWATEYAERDPEGFAVFVAKAPVVIPVDKLPGKKPDSDDPALSQATLTVAKMMGVTEADIKQYGA